MSVVSNEGKHWDDYLNHIQESDEIFKPRKKEMFQAISAFKELLGQNWLESALKLNHPLFWELRGIHGAANHSMILKWGLALHLLQKSAGFENLLKRIKSKNQFYSVMPELELAYRLKKNGAKVIFNPNFEGKHPDILCNFNNSQMFFEAKGIGSANRTNRANITIAKLSAHSKIPILPCGKVFKILDDKELEECTKKVEQKCNEAIKKNSGVECFIPNQVKFYFVPDSVKNKAELYKKWCNKQKFFEGIYHGGLLYPNDRVQQERRVKQRLQQITKDKQLPNGGIVFLASTEFYLSDFNNVTKMINMIRSNGKKFPNISVIILYCWIFGFDNEKNIVVKDDDHVLRTTYSYDDLREDMLIIKNNFSSNNVDLEMLVKLVK